MAMNATGEMTNQVYAVGFWINLSQVMLDGPMIAPGRYHPQRHWELYDPKQRCDRRV